MKHLSRIFIGAGAGLVLLICILIGVLHSRNLSKQEEERAITIENNLKEYLNERVNEIEPQYIEANNSELTAEQRAEAQKIFEDRRDELVHDIISDLSKQLLEEIDKQYLSREELSDMNSSLMKQWNDTVLTDAKNDIKKELQQYMEQYLQQETTKQQALSNGQLLEQLTEVFVSKEELAKVTTSLVEQLENTFLTDTKADMMKEVEQYVGQKISKQQTLFLEKNNALKTEFMNLLETYKTENAQTLEAFKTEYSAQLDTLKEENSSMQKTITDLNNQIVALQEQIHILNATRSNIRVERWDAATQSLYLVPVE